MERSTDILESLAHVVQENTKFYRSDFVYDAAELTKAVLKSDRKDRIFYWMSRPAGTWCVKEREAFLRGTSAHSIWTYYADQPDGIKAYRVTVTGQQEGHILGHLVPLNYREQVRRVQAHALPAASVTVEYESGYTAVMPFPKDTRAIPTVLPEHGGICHVCYAPESEAELVQVILEEHRWQTGKIKKGPPKRRSHPGR